MTLKTAGSERWWHGVGRGLWYKHRCFFYEWNVEVLVSRKLLGNKMSPKWERRVQTDGTGLGKSLAQTAVQSRAGCGARPGSLVRYPASDPFCLLGFFCRTVQCCWVQGGHSAGRCVQVTSMFKDPGQWKQQNLAPLEHVLFPAPSLCTLELDQKEQSVQRTLNFTFSFHFPGSIFHSYWSRFVLLRWSTFTWRPQPGMDLASKWIGKCRCLFYLTSLCDL